MHTQNVNVKTAAQESSRKIGGESVPYRILHADCPKNSDEEWDVMEFSSLDDLKNYRRRCPEKMSFLYSYVLSCGLDKQFHHIAVAEADHFKQFIREIRLKGVVI